MARQEVFDRMAIRRPQRSDHPHPLERQVHVGLPLVQQAVQHRVQVFLRGIPGLHQVIVQAHQVDGLDGRFGIGIGRQQHFARLGEDLDRLRKELDAAHLWHALIDHQQRHAIVALAELAQHIQRLLARVGLHNAIVPPIFLAQVAFDRVQHRSIVINCQDCCLTHTLPLP